MERTLINSRQARQDGQVYPYRTPYRELCGKTLKTCLACLVKIQLKMLKSNRQFQNFCEYQFKGNYNRCCNFPNCMQIFESHATSLNNNIMSNLNFHSQALFN